jgi:hypothetical protein
VGLGEWSRGWIEHVNTSGLTVFIVTFVVVTGPAKFKSIE